MSAKPRKRIPKAIEFEVDLKSGRRCCVCKMRGDHIHHIDGNPANNAFENLVLLCFNDHNEASITGGLRRGLTMERIVRYRDRHYSEVAKEKAAAIKVVTSDISKLTSEDLLQAAKDAIIILDLENIKADYNDADWAGKEEQVRKLNKFIEHSSDRAAYDILAFLEIASSETRVGMPNTLSSSIVWMALSYYPTSYRKSNKQHDLETGKLCLAIGFNTAYDCAIKLKKLSLIPNGLTLWKHLYKHAKQTKNLKLQHEVQSNYDNLEETLQRPERDDLGNALELVRIFRADLEEPSLAFPLYTEHLVKLIKAEEKPGELSKEL